VRRDESRARANLPAEDVDDYFQCKLFRPLIDWTKKMCFDYLAAHGEEVNPLYRMGFGRVGCAPCVNSSKDDIRNWAARFPEMIDKVRVWETRNGKPFFLPRSGEDTLWIDDKVAWSRTEFGGKQYSLPFVEAESGCSSLYGLCE